MSIELTTWEIFQYQYKPASNEKIALHKPPQSWALKPYTHYSDHGKNRQEQHLLLLKEAPTLQYLGCFTVLN